MSIEAQATPRPAAARALRLRGGSHTGWSVIVTGVTELVTHPSEIRRLDSLGLEPWAPGRKAHWVHIRAWTVSGRRIVIPPEKLAYHLG